MYAEIKIAEHRPIDAPDEPSEQRRVKVHFHHGGRLIETHGAILPNEVAAAAHADQARAACEALGVAVRG